MLAACGIRTNGTGFHVCGTMKGNLHPIPFRFPEHLGCGFADCDIPDVEAFLFSFLFDLLSFFFLHHFSSFVDIYSFKEY
jgi:hypothetical protein